MMQELVDKLCALFYMQVLALMTVRIPSGLKSLEPITTEGDIASKRILLKQSFFYFTILPNNHQTKLP